MDSITVQAGIAAKKNKVWDYYTNPKHIVNWNFASEDWCCPSAENDLRVGGTYKARMEAKDGSFGFDLIGVYKTLNPKESFSYEFGGRQVTVNFIENGDTTQVNVTFDPEAENSLDMQRNGWQAILDNFKKYTESH